MTESVDHLLRELGGRVAEWQEKPRQYRTSLPHSSVPARPAPARDRYRSSRRDDDIYEDVDEYGQDMCYDEFDQNLLHQSYDDRIRQAVRGDARLSLPPRTTKHCLEPSSQPNPFLQGLAPRPCISVDDQAQSQRSYQDLSRFAYGSLQDQDTSSDAPFGISSSPAFKAAQRRAEPRYTTIHHTTGQHANDESHSHAHLSNDHPISMPSQQLTPQQSTLTHIGPICQGIPLVAVSNLPDRLQQIFPFPTFNAVQSRCFSKVYTCNDNFVLSSPTGSGKTAILELAICRAFTQNLTGQYKIVYQAPTKALCSERQRDWEKKFKSLNLTSVELTGDSDHADLSNVQQADIIITTPEKWDSVTRKWKDHEKLMRLVKLFLIDEVHILKEDRGAILEAVVSRMKTVGTGVRFIALSATVPNFDDVAAWLGRNYGQPNLPANSESFGDEFRPVRLRKHVCGYQTNGNDFQFEKFLNDRLPEVISKYSEGKPIMIFCFTRASTVSTAKMLATWFASATQTQRRWKAPSKPVPFQDRELRDCAMAAVAFHHGGLDVNDRLGVEQGYLNGEINVICCTSTLAVGVNLPCHFIIIKNTVAYGNDGLQEYSDLEIMQMLGRAGRPQFDDSAVAVILTRQSKTKRYEKMVSGQELLESNLHLGFIDHLNAEIGLGTINDLTSARKWLSGTFLHVRLKKNPGHYKLEGKFSQQTIEEHLDNICLSSLDLLQQTNLIEGGNHFTCTESGHAMARYYVQFKTMQVLLGLPPKAQISEILSAVAQAAEFRELRFRSGEKSLYKNLNQSLQIRFPIPVTLTLPAHKVSLIIQSVLGAADVNWDKDTAKHRNQYNLEANAVFRHATRLIRCIIDCQLYQDDAIAANHALMVERSLCARAWDDVPVHMKQIPDIGNVSVRKLINADIKTIEELEFTDAQRIETVLGRNPPFGLKLIDRLKLFPKLRISVNVLPNMPKKRDDGVEVKMKADFGFLNEKPPSNWKGKAIYVCLLAERSDGHKVHFARISGKRLGGGQQLEFVALLTNAAQCVNVYVMCNEIAGTMRQVTAKPKIAPSMFPKPETFHLSPQERPISNTSRRRTDSGSQPPKMPGPSDEFDDGIDDADLVHASYQDLDFDHIENYANPVVVLTRRNTNKNASNNDTSKGRPPTRPIGPDNYEPKQLDNGKWACNHVCKDKTACKHLCCRDGLDKPPKRPAKKIATTEATSSNEIKRPAEKDKKTQTKVQLQSSSKRKYVEQPDEVDLTAVDKRKKVDGELRGPTDYHNLQQLHDKVQKVTNHAHTPAPLVMKAKPAYCYARGGSHSLSFLDGDRPQNDVRSSSSDYEDALWESFSPSLERLVANPDGVNTGSDTDDMQAIRQEGCVRGGCLHDPQSEAFGDDDSMFGDALVGLADSQNLQERREFNDGSNETLNDRSDNDIGLLRSPKKTIKLDAQVETQAPGTTYQATAYSPHFARRPKGTTQLVFQSSSSENQYDDAKNASSTSTGRMLDEPQACVDDARKICNHFLSSNATTSVVVGALEPKNVDQDEQMKVPEEYKDIEPWLFEEFGDIVELADG